MKHEQEIADGDCVNVPDNPRTIVECLAVIKNARLGYDYDYGGLCLKFSTYVSESYAAGQGINGIELQQAFLDTEAPNAEWFNGRTCWVEYNGSSSIRYLRMFKNA